MAWTPVSRRPSQGGPGERDDVDLGQPVAQGIITSNGCCSSPPFLCRDARGGLQVRAFEDWPLDGFPGLVLGQGGSPIAAAPTTQSGQSLGRVAASAARLRYESAFWPERATTGGRNPPQSARRQMAGTPGKLPKIAMDLQERV
jgi:hypothetical protein